MPIYMDIHIVPGVKSRDVAEAHRKDILVEEAYACKCMTYWIDEERENIFCLIDAPSREAVEEMHNRAHGLIPHKIIEVSSSLVESFLGRIYDPSEATLNHEGLKVFHDPSFRILLVTKISDPVLLHYKLGADKATELIKHHNDIVRKNLARFEGREVEHAGPGFIGSFASASKAVSCAVAIQNELEESDAATSGFRIALNGGEPVSKSDKLFGDTIQTALYMCAIENKHQIAVAPSVKELISKDYFQNNQYNILTVSPQDQHLLELLFNKLEENWQDPDFAVTDYCQAMAMSKSQLYRKTVELFNVSPNQLLKDFRLEKAKELMRKQRYSISQITFDTGFTSPSYFTKCFKKKYGLLPMTYIDLLH